MLEINHSPDQMTELIHSLTEENQMFHAMLESPYEGIIYVDENGIIRYLNEGLARYIKIPRDKIVDHPLKDFPFDPNIELALKAAQFEPLLFIDIGKFKFIVSRRPVFRNKKYAGIFNWYFSISARDVEENWGEHYLDLIAKVQAKDIMFTIKQTLVELDSYKDEFHKIHRAHLGIDSIVGSTPVMKELKKRVLLVGESPSSVLITGESGTGKELFAQAIHYHGSRAPQPFVKVNCAAIPENLLESELFGYMEGAFTGARKGGKMGKFELANKGTIFLDEIGDMPLAMQAKLLRVLQEKEIERLGGEKTIPINVRVLSATNKDLQKLVEEGRFREDLYYRLNVVNLHIPPLRERKSDLPEIIDYALEILNKNLNMSILKISPEALRMVLAYDWPGNIRELINVLEAAMNFCPSNIIEVDALPYSLHSRVKSESPIEPRVRYDLQGRMDDVEKEQLVKVLKQCQGRRKDAAAVLNLSKSTLYRLMKKHNLL